MAKQTAEQIAKWAEDKELPDIMQISAFTADCPVTPDRRKLLAVLCLPQSATMAITDICRYAGVDRQTYYNAIKNPEFNALQIRLARQLNSCNALRYRHKYDELAVDKLNPDALKKLNMQTGILDPDVKSLNITGSIIKADLTELLALIKEQQIDSEDITDLVDVIEDEIASLEGSTVEEGEVPGIPQENIGPSLSEKNKNGSHLTESPDSEKNSESDGT